MLYDAANSLADLDQLGLLHVTTLPKELTWLTPVYIEMLRAVARCGEEGMSQRKTKRLDTERCDALRMLELRDLLCREHDRFGKPVFFCLTWQGTEAVQVLEAVERHRNTGS